MISYDINQVKLLDNVSLKRQENIKRYVLNFDVDRLMHTFRITAGIKSDAEPLGGWESPGCAVRGHFVGHFLAACAKFAYGSGNDAFKTKAEQIIDIMAECVQPNGYLSAFDEKALDTLEENENFGVWAPYYTLHKIINGLVCCAKYINNDKALALAKNLALYIYERFKKLSHWKIDNILRCVRTNPVNEFGGIGDSLYSLFEINHDTRILELAKLFDRDYFIGNLSRGNDILQDLHANTHLPLVISALHRYNITKEEEYKIAGLNFYKYLKPRTFANGNNSSRAKHFRKNEVSENSEHWGGEYLTVSDITGGESESCCAHNTENILRYLIDIDEDDRLEYLNHMECIKYNAVLNCASDETGLSQYHQPMGKDKVKKFSSLYDDFWCCTASGVEAMSELQKDIWFNNGDSIVINMFVSSLLTLENKVSITMTTDFPKSNKATLKINTNNEVRLKIAFKNNSLLSARINDTQYTLIRDGIYATLDSSFIDNDTISLEINADIRVVPLNRFDDAYCFMYGNILLANIEGKADKTTVLDKNENAEFIGDSCRFIPLYMVEDEPYTVYINSESSGEAKDGSSVYKTK